MEEDHRLTEDRDAYPPSWSKLLYPNQRRELLIQLREFSDVEYQKIHWLEYSRDPREQWNTLRGAISDFLDGRNFADDEYIESALGIFLLNSSEVEFIMDAAHLLKSITRELKIAPPKIYFEHPRWIEFVDASRKAYEMMKDK